MIKLITMPDDKNMANGYRNESKTPLTDEEIQFIKSEIKRIGADETKFVFNDEQHISKSTCYSIEEDIVYVTRNVFPDDRYGSTHPRDLMSVGAVLAHEYYGHRTYREEYLSDIAKGEAYLSTPYWQDECRASITAAKIAPGLTQMDKSNLIQDAVYRAKEFGHLIEMDDFMKEVVYGYSDGEKNITNIITPIHYVSEASQNGNDERGICENKMSEVPVKDKYFYDLEW